MLFRSKTGEVIAALQYDGGYHFTEDGLALVYKGGKWGYIGKTGKETIALQYDRGMVFSGGLAAVCKNGKWGFINTAGKTVVSTSYDAVGPIYEGLAKVCKNNRWGYIDKTGKEVVSPQYEASSRFSQGLAAVKKDGKWGYIDQTGKTVVTPKYTYAGNLSEDGLAAVSSAGKYGYINKSGKEAIAPAYEKALDCSEGVAAVCKDGKWGCVDISGYVLVPLEYDAIGEFAGDTAIVRKGGTYAFLNVTVGGFSDVLISSVYAQSIDWAVAKGITKGTTATTFSPDSQCKTSQILTFLWRGAGRPGAASAEMSWADEMVVVTNWAKSKGIDVPADLNTICTRASAVTYMWKAAGSHEPTVSAVFTDVPASADYAKAVSWALEQGVTTGTGDGTTFSPDRGCTRGQIATFLYREQAQ